MVVKTGYKRKVAYKKRTMKRKPKSVKVITANANISKIVNSILGRKVEMKYQQSAPITNITLTSTNATPPLVISYFVTPLVAPFGNIAQGFSQGARNGNEILLRKWSIRLILSPNIVPAGVYHTASQLNVTVYIANRKDYSVITPLIPEFYQNGNASFAPTGVVTDNLAWINKDVYNVIYKKKFKVGTASTGIAGSTLTNNDYNLTQTMSVNLCNHGFKNHKVKYDDTAAGLLGFPSDARLTSLYLFAIVTNASGQALELSTSAICTYDISMFNNIAYTDM